jgi:glycosyltransferase involved in cell wall biosynthesis
MSPLKLFEYMASKNPIVTTALPVINEVLVDRRDAIFVKPSNAEDMARGIGLLIKNPILAAKISGKAFEEVSSHYTWMARAKRISDAIASRYTGQFLAK